MNNPIVGLTRKGRKILALQSARFGEPWRAGKSRLTIVTDAPGGVAGRDGPIAREDYGGRLVAESMAPTERDRAIACVNFCAGVELPEGVAPGGLIDILDSMEDLYRTTLRGEHAFASPEATVARVEIAQRVLRAMGRIS